MTRKEGIILAWQCSKPQNKYLVPDKAIFETEYLNYCELCSFCSEQPKPKDVWLNEKIKF